MVENTMSNQMVKELESFYEAHGICNLKIDGKVIYSKQVATQPKVIFAKLKEIRTLRKIGVKKLADLISDNDKHITWTYIRAWEEKPEFHRDVEEKFINRICDVLGCTRKQLSGEEPFDLNTNNYVKAKYHKYLA